MEAYDTAGGEKPLKQLQYFITAVWGFLTPSLAFDGAQQLVAALKQGEAQGDPTPMEYMLLLVLAAGGCVLAFLFFDALFSAYALPKTSGRFRGFLMNLLLYVALVPVGWLAVTHFVSALGS